MNQLQCEATKTYLPDYMPKVHMFEDVPWLGLIEVGNAVVLSSIPRFDTFEEFANFLFENERILVVSKDKDLDHCLDFLTPEQKRAITRQHIVWCGDTMLKPGELLIGGILLRVRPLGRVGIQGLTKISVRMGNKKGGYILDLGCLASSTEDIDRALKECDASGVYLPPSVSMAGICRSLLIRDCWKAFAGVIDKLGPDYEDIYRCSSLVFRLGRFEALWYGTIPDAYVYDIKSAYPSRLDHLQYAAPPYTEWMKWQRDNEDLKRDDLAYANIYVEEDLPYFSVGMGSQRINTLSGTKLVYPWGPARRWIGLQQMRLRQLAGIKFEVLDGWLGIKKAEYHPFDKLARKMWRGRQNYPALFKQLDTRIVGNFMSTYWDIENDGSIMGHMVKKALETYCPIYASAVIDEVLAGITAICLEVPQDKVYGISIDGVQLGTKLSVPECRGKLALKYHGPIRKFSDHLGDVRGSFRWSEAYRGDYLEVKAVGRPSLMGCFGRPGDLEAQQRRFSVEGPTTTIIKVPVGPSKRLAIPKIDFMKECAYAETPHTRDMYTLYAGNWLEEDYAQQVDEGV